MGLLGLARHLEQVGAHGVQPVVPGEALVLLEVVQHARARRPAPRPWRARPRG